jgi:hypothetical protein
MSDSIIASSALAAKPGNPLLDAPLEEIPDQWREHARELRRENAKWREMARQQDESAQQRRLDDALAVARREHEEKTSALLQAERAAAGKRIVAAEVRSVALALGIQDLDALKLLDTSRVSVDADSGEVGGVRELLEQFRQSKPYLFRETARDTTQTRGAPPAANGRKFDARHATREELASDAKARGLRIKQF